jgi:hypothetical protein
MTCPFFQMSSAGRRGIGVNQPQSGLDYPLVNPSDDVRYLLADAYLAYDDPGNYTPGTVPRKHPLRIKYLYGVGCETSTKPAWANNPVHAADVLIVDADDNVVFDSTQLVPVNGDGDYQAFSTRSWGDDYVIYEWLGNNAVCRIVVYATWPEEFQIAPKNWPTHFVPTSAVLDERAVYRMPKRLRSLKFFNHGVSLGTARRNHVVFAGGNNMVLTPAAVADTTSSRNTTTITFDATAGSGTGKYNNCTELPTTAIHRMNGVAPNQYGDFLLSASECLWIRQDTAISGGRATPVPQALIIGSNCPPCCDCADYVAAAKYMNDIQANYAAIGDRVHTVKLLHEGNIARWLDQRNCRLQKPLRVLLTPQYCPVMDVVLMYCNQCVQCAEHPEVSVTFSTFPTGATAEVMCGFTTLYAPGVPGREFGVSGTWPTFTAQFPPINLGNSAYVKFRLKFSPNTTAYAVTATLTGTIDGVPIRPACATSGDAASAVDTQTLNCQPDGSTTTNC